MASEVKADFDGFIPPPPKAKPTRTAIVSSVTGWAAFGVLVRAWHLGIQRKNVLWRPRNHAIAAAVFGIWGYYAAHLEVRQREIIQEKLAVIRRNREVQDARSAALKDVAKRVGEEGADNWEQIAKERMYGMEVIKTDDGHTLRGDDKKAYLDKLFAKN